jgi:Protein of unknown function (DUF3592)
MASRSTLFGVLSILVGVVALVIVAQEWLKTSRVKSTGVAAVVQAPRDYTERKSRGSTTYSAEFTFKTQTGDVVTMRRQFPGELRSDFRAGNPVKIFYDPRNPSNFVFEKEGFPWFATLVGIGFLVVGPVLIRRQAS